CGIDRTLTRDENIFAVMLFERDIVVMTVYCQFRFELLTMIEHLVEYLQQASHHYLAVLHCIGLGPLQIFPISLKLRRTINEVSQVRSRQFIQTPETLGCRDVTFC